MKKIYNNGTKTQHKHGQVRVWVRSRNEGGSCNHIPEPAITNYAEKQRAKTCAIPAETNRSSASVRTLSGLGPAREATKLRSFTICPSCSFSTATPGLSNTKNNTGRLKKKKNKKKAACSVPGFWNAAVRLPCQQQLYHAPPAS